MIENKLRISYIEGRARGSKRVIVDGGYQGNKINNSDKFPKPNSDEFPKQS